MTIETAVNLEEQTNVFWNLSSCWFGRPSKEYTVEQATKAANQARRNLGPQRGRLLHHITALQDAIVKGGRRQKKGSPTKNILQLRISSTPIVSKG